jgi:hypothetical protein
MIVDARISRNVIKPADAAAAGTARTSSLLEEHAMPATTVSDLEARLRMIEDRLDIYNLIAGHPPSADTGADYYTRAVY